MSMLLEAARRASWAIWARVLGVVGWVEGEAVAMRILEGAIFAVVVGTRWCWCWCWCWWCGNGSWIAF